MKKTLDATLKSETHFEQIPLEEVVKKIANNLTFEPPSEKTEPYSMPAASLRLVASGSGPNHDRSRR
jgi:hypothetical protein